MTLLLKITIKANMYPNNSNNIDKSTTSNLSTVFRKRVGQLQGRLDRPEGVRLLERLRDGSLLQHAATRTISRAFG